jgi:hypothetical protein
MGFGPAWRATAVGVAALAFLGSACSARHFGPVPSPVGTVPGPVQSLAFRSGEARVELSAPITRRFTLPLQPSDLFASPPAQLELAFGDVSSGEGIDLQLPAGTRTARTSPNTILTLTLPFPKTGLTQLTSMDGECAIVLTRETDQEVRGRFRCHSLHGNVGSGPPFSATGTFSATR